MTKPVCLPASLKIKSTEWPICNHASDASSGLGPPIHDFIGHYLPIGGLAFSFILFCVALIALRHRLMHP